MGATEAMLLAEILLGAGGMGKILAGQKKIAGSIQRGVIEKTASISGIRERVTFFEISGAGVITSVKVGAYYANHSTYTERGNGRLILTCDDNRIFEFAEQNLTGTNGWTYQTVMVDPAILVSQYDVENGFAYEGASNNTIYINTPIIFENHLKAEYVGIDDYGHGANASASFNYILDSGGVVRKLTYKKRAHAALRKEFITGRRAA